MSEDDLIERAAKRVWRLRMDRWEERRPSDSYPMVTWDNETNTFKDDVREDVRAVLDEVANQPRLG